MRRPGLFVCSIPEFMPFCCLPNFLVSVSTLVKKILQAMSFYANATIKYTKTTITQSSTMSKISFQSKSSTSKTVSTLLDSVLPGHSTTVSDPTTSSTSQVINASRKKLKPEEVRRLKKKQKLDQRHAARKAREERERLENLARYQLLKQHSEKGKLTEEEEIELKRLVEKNLVTLQSWRTDADDDLEEIQQQILSMQKSDYARKNRRVVGKKIDMKALYNKTLSQKRHPGLTPGLAPVDMEDSDSDE